MDSSSHYLGSSKNIGGSQGTESGWTNYIGSFIHDRHSEDGHNSKQANHKNGGGYGSDNEDGESDDSMVSDASSGPSQSEIPTRQKKGTVSWSRKEQKLGKPRGGARFKLEEEEEECMVEAKSAASHTGSKMRKCK
ncbi:unnamed protein product [Linum tenue]|uniref:Uncharacterized protein n=1 Tax=Linum tenue TaxID=586396 RepID=A0AAV0LF34_9ROSI|nr:unnamed protein product [Linum tenue]